LNHINRSDNIRAAWEINKDGVRSLGFHYLDITGYGANIASCIKILRSIINQGGVVYGAFEDNNIVGIASVLPNQGNTKKFSILASIDVTFSHRRKGIGKTLLDTCVKYSQESGCDTILVNANPYESTIKFFKSFGFLYTQNLQNKTLVQDNLVFPKFDFPPPFGGNVEHSVYLELPLDKYKSKDYFYNRITLDEITQLNYYGTTRLTVTDKQSFTFGNNPVYFMASYKYEFGENHKMLVACFDTFPVGFIGYGEHDGKSVLMEPFMVDSSFQRKGISLKILELFEQRIRDLKYEKITLGFRTDNIAAGKAYEKAGYILTKVDHLQSYGYKIL
jgi:GNAT superfamily N-acetyltransferase